MNTECCGRCKYFDAYEHNDDGNAQWGVCRRFPPVLFPTDKSSVNITDVISSAWRQPMVLQNDWCGEFKQKP